MNDNSEQHPPVDGLREVAGDLAQLRVSTLDAEKGVFYSGCLTPIAAWKVFDFLYANGFEVVKRR
jgi:hypothetical protein